LQNYLDLIEAALRSPLEATQEKKLAYVWGVLLRLTVILHKDGDNVATLKTVEGFMDIFEANSGRMTDFGRLLLRDLLQLCSNMATLSLCDINFVGHCTELTTLVLCEGKRWSP
jgi:hypothetical protein